MSEKTNIPQNFNFDPGLFYDAIVRSTDDYVYIVDMKSDVALVSENMQRDFELPGPIVPGLIPLWGKRIHERDRKRYFDATKEMLQGDTDEHNVEYQIRNYLNEYIWVRCRGRLHRDEEGSPVMFAGVVTDLSNRGKVDFVTGLFVQVECERLIENILEKGTSLAGILLLGLDDFSNINNLSGHRFGDAVLRQFAQEVQRLLPPEAQLFRFDGDQFIIVYRDATYEILDELYQKIRSYGNCRRRLDKVSYHCTVSGGIAMSGRDGASYPELVKSAMAAMEVSKQGGKNRCTRYEPRLIETKLRSWLIRDQLHNSVINHMEGFSLVYQPITRAEDLKVTEAEALLRWSGGSLGNVFPDEFIPILEESGLIIQVGKWVLEEAARQCSVWRSFNPDFIVNVNCSYLQFLDDTFLAFINSTLKKFGLMPENIVLELTESRFVTDKERLKTILEALKQMRVRLAIDDFGTGYSSLGLLSNMPADIVKIDRSFITQISDDEHAFNRAFIGAVIKLCHSVGIAVCVEGVEYRDELEAVVGLEADRIQGFYISRPVPAGEFEKKFCGGVR